MERASKKVAERSVFRFFYSIRVPRFSKKIARLEPNLYYLINDFSVKFNRPIYNKAEGDRIFSVQVDHVLIGRSGIVLLETKNWSRASVQNLDMRSPVDQIKRTSFALFVLLNGDAG